MALLCLLCLLLSVSPLKAFDQPIVAAYVQDPSGAPLHGARATLSHSSGKLYNAVADDTGYIRFSRLPAGQYELRIEHQHFAPFVQTLMIDRQMNDVLRIKLELAATRQEVTIAENPAAVSTDPERNADAIRLDRVALDDLPAIDDDVVAAAARFLDSSLAGSAGPTLVVDGIETDKAGVSKSAITEVRINQNPYSAEFVSPGGGRVEITTKQEASALHGILNFRFRDSWFDARNAFAIARPEEQRRSLEGSLSGPLGRSGKQSFVISGEREIDASRSLIYARTPAGLVTDQVLVPAAETELSARWNYRPNDAGRWSLRFESEGEREENGGIGGFRLRELATASQEREKAVSLDYTRVLSARALLQARVRVRHNGSDTRGANEGTPQIVVQDAFSAGGAQVNSSSTSVRAETGLTAAVSAAHHYLRFGAAVRELGRYAIDDRNNRTGTFNFSSLDEYLNGQPFSFTRQSGNGRIAYSRQEYGFFLQDDWKPRRNLSLSLGVRYDRQTWPMDGNNMAPRFSVAWSPGEGGKTVLRGGSGVFYDRMDRDAQRDVLQFDGARLVRIVVSQPGYPDPLNAGREGVRTPPAVVRFAPKLRSPYLIHSSIGVDRQLWRKTTLSLVFSSVEGRKMFRSRDINAPDGPDYVRPDPTLSVVRQIESSATMRGRSLQVSLRGDFSRWLSGFVRYTAGRTYNDTLGVDALPADSLDLTREWARADYDRLHRFSAVGSVKLHRWINVGLSVEASGGRPYTVTTGKDDNRDGIAKDRPPGAPRNGLDGPGEFSIDARWSRDMKLRKGSEQSPALSFIVDAYNILNRVNYQGYVGNLSSPFFGRPVSARSPRRMQFGIRLRF